MKKILSLLLAVCILLSLAACGDKDGSSPKTEPDVPSKTQSDPPADTPNPSGDTNKPAEGSNELVIYTAGDQATLDSCIPGFEAETGIHVEIVSAGTGELLNRIVSEAENPLGDVELGGTVSVVLPYKDYFEPYVSANEDAQINARKTVEGCINCNTIIPMCFVVNTKLAGDLEINSYEDLLNPELKGKIAFVGPAQSSTGVQHLTTMLAVKGADDEEKGWEYVEQFVANLDSKMLSSSGDVPRRVAEGEYVVGLTHELMVQQYIDSGYSVERVYPEDGLFVSAGTVQIIKGAKNMENAKKFVDYLTTQEAQLTASELNGQRGSRNDVPGPEGTPDVSTMNILVEDVYDTLEHTQEYLERFKDLYIS